ncbi:MAG: hypothetical protein K2G38_03265 [Clostridia bacterium]|nr:hypothetical protein [Clostridia bacterium]
MKKKPIAIKILIVFSVIFGMLFFGLLILQISGLESDAVLTSVAGVLFFAPVLAILIIKLKGLAADSKEKKIKQEYNARGEIYITTKEKRALQELVHSKFVPGTKCVVCGSTIEIDSYQGAERVGSVLVDVPDTYVAIGDTGVVKQAQKFDDIVYRETIRYNRCPKCRYRWRYETWHKEIKKDRKDSCGDTYTYVDKTVEVEDEHNFIDWGDLKKFME